MSAQIVFLTLFLGLTSGSQEVDLDVDGAVKSVRIVSGERQLALLTAPPWSAKIDLGPLAPQELTAIGLDANGNEIARTSQIINLPRSPAEFEIALTSGGTQRFAALRWRHLTGSKPANAKISVDGSQLRADRDFRAKLPHLDPNTPHVISAEMYFQDGSVARKEIIIEGLRSDSMGTQLTPVLLTEDGPAPKTFNGCFSAFGNAVRVNAVEKPEAHVMVVQEPDPSEAAHIFWVLHAVRMTIAPLPAGINVRIIWPIARPYEDRGLLATLFERSIDVKGSDEVLHLSTRSQTVPTMLGMADILSTPFYDRSRFDDPTRFADAVAVAGLGSMFDGFRRAVVLVLSHRKDVSENSPEMVRRYLAAIHVPLFVWSLEGPRPDLASTWGTVEDVSSSSRLIAATNRLRATLDAQRVALLAVDPLTALHVDVKPECGLRAIE
jgi:hypothetical protein